MPALAVARGVPARTGRLVLYAVCTRRWFQAHPGGHYLIGIALSNLASVHQARKAYGRAEPLYREAIGIYRATQGPDHLNTGIARIKLGRTLLRQGRLAEAETETRAGYEVLVEQTDPSVSWLRSAREDLVAAYEGQGKRDEAARFRAELAEAAALAAAR